MPCLSNRGAHRRAFGSLDLTRITPVTAGDRVDSLENCDMNDRHRAAGPRWSKLLAKDTRLPRGNGSVIKPAGINCNLIPITNRIEHPRRGMLEALSDTGDGFKMRSQRVAMTAGKTLRPGDGGKAINKKAEDCRNYPTIETSRHQSLLGPKPY